MSAKAKPSATAPASISRARGARKPGVKPGKRTAVATLPSLRPGAGISKRQVVDIFCRVIDNYGDAGVCWRLARQLVFEHGLKVRLIIDRPAVLADLVPALKRRLSLGARPRRASPTGLLIEGVRIFEWKTRLLRHETGHVNVLSGPARLLKPADLVIAAFACSLPDSYREQMAARPRFRPPAEARPAPPGTGRRSLSRWVNLEYLSAEDWVEGSHALPSLKPDGLVEHFYFPGFTPRTGGLLREPALLARRDAFLRDRQAQEKLAAELGLNAVFSRPREESLVIFVFCYPQAPLMALMREAGKLVAGSGLHLPLSRPADGASGPVAPALSTDLSTQFSSALSGRMSTGLSPVQGGLSTDLATGNSDLPHHLPPAFPQTGPGMTRIRHVHFLLPEGMQSDAPASAVTALERAFPGLHVHLIARLPQARFDEVLWFSDINAVRGEDSFVRALWAGKPMLWHIYPQDEDAHRPKLEAFLRMRTEAERELMLAWNGFATGQDMGTVLARWLGQFTGHSAASRALAARLAGQTDLATQLLNDTGIKPKKEASSARIGLPGPARL